MGVIANLRRPKLPGDVAAFDVIATIAVAWIYSIIRKTSFIRTTGTFFIIAIVVHYVFNVPTRLNAYI